MPQALLYTNNSDRFTGCDAGEQEAEQTTDSYTRMPSLFCTGVYSPSGVDLTRILVSVVPVEKERGLDAEPKEYHIAIRPNPTVDLGPVDASSAIVLCDLSLPDEPIIYVSDAYLTLTKYARHEVLGRNCRFLQRPPQMKDSLAYCSDSDAVPSTFVDPDARETMRTAVSQNEELRLEVPNFRRDGRLFVNVLTIVPVPDEAVGPKDRRRHRYSIGFLCDQATVS